jgi:hypothetical protein
LWRRLRPKLDCGAKKRRRMEYVKNKTIKAALVSGSK